MDDSQIVLGLYRRDEYCLQAADDKYRGLMYGVARNILGSAQDAEECVNDALMDIWNSIPPHNPTSLKAYSAVLVRRRAIKRLEYNNAEKRSAETVNFDELEECIADGETVEEGVITSILNDFLEALGKSERVIFMQHYYLGISIPEIAENHSISTGNVTSKLFRTRNKLKKYLEKRGIKV